MELCVEPWGAWGCTCGLGGAGMMWVQPPEQPLPASVAVTEGGPVAVAANWLSRASSEDLQGGEAQTQHVGERV